MWKIHRKIATGEICLWQPVKEPLHSTHTAFSHCGTRSHAPGWSPLSYMWNCLPPYNHHPLPISAQIHHPTLQAWPQWGCWLEFTALFTTPRRKHSFSQVQPASNLGTPAMPLCTQSVAGSFLRDRILAKQHAYLPSDEEQGWKGSVTNTQLPTNPISEDTTATESACLPQKHILGNTQLNSTKPCVPLHFRPTHPMRSQPFQLLRVKGKKQWLLSNNFSALFYTGLWQVRVLKGLKLCEVYNLVYLLGTEMISFYTPLQLLGSLLSWDVKVIFVPVLIYISSY